MSWLSKLPTNSVLRERLALEEQKYNVAVSEIAKRDQQIKELEQQITKLNQDYATLRDRIPQETTLSEDTTRAAWLGDPK